jgi:SAM-dependent methyltransferase
MNASVSDKAKILPYIQSGNILEIGCGNGTVLEMISEFSPGSSVYGVDMSAQLLGLATQRKYKGDVHLYCCDAKKLKRIDDAPKKFDTIVFCSVLHEIYSGFLANSTVSNTLDDALNKTIGFIKDMCNTYLTENGRLIIRDGVKPKNEMVYVDFHNPEQKDIFFQFVDDFSPFKIEFNYSSSTGKIRINSSHLFEFLTKYFYEKNWNIEVTEQFGWVDFQKINELLTSYSMYCGSFNGQQSFLNHVHSESYTLDFLEDKWNNDFTMTTTDNQPYMPCSTMIYVAQQGYR